MKPINNFHDLLVVYKNEILIALLFMAVSILILILIALSKSKVKAKQMFIGSIITFLIFGGLNYILIRNINVATKIIFSRNYAIIISPILRLILVNVALFSLYFLIVYNIYNSKQKLKEELTTSRIAFLGILIGVSSILMMLGFPVLPGATFLKLEISGLIVFMTFLWFDIKNAIIVSALTNFIHVFMPGSPPLIPFLDETINFIATMAFILPSYFYLRNKDKENFSNKAIIILTLIGVLFTTIFMVLYNAFFNLPVVYEMKWEMLEVILTFGTFNIIKWGSNAAFIILLWKKLVYFQKY